MTDPVSQKRPSAAEILAENWGTRKRSKSLFRQEFTMWSIVGEDFVEGELAAYVGGLCVGREF